MLIRFASGHSAVPQKHTHTLRFVLSTVTYGHHTQNTNGHCTRAAVLSTQRFALFSGRGEMVLTGDRPRVEKTRKGTRQRVAPTVRVFFFFLVF